VRDEINALGWLIRTAVLVAVGAAVYKELRKPPSDRTWQGKLLGVVPYDFRLPTIARLRDAYWNRRSNRLFSDKPVGVGWSVNVAALLKRLGVIGGPARTR
jgi:hypothetical protein